ncbi:hypothetical protein MMC12_007431 [Toensbergia leucococca]|nr:hypothetical protein [Toensbergia leucococca]
MVNCTIPGEIRHALKQILLSPRIGLYVTEFGSSTETAEQSDLVPGTGINQLYCAIMSSKFFIAQTDVIWTMRKAITEKEDFLLAILLPLLPNLTALTLAGNFQDSEWLIDIVAKIAKTAIPRNSFSLLPCLTSVTASYQYHDAHPDRLRLLASLAALPSMREINASGVYALQYRCRFPPRSSPVSHVSFDSSRIGMKALSKFLSMMKSLRSFSYSPVDGSQWNPSRICATLVRHAKFSLEKLSLGGVGILQIYRARGHMASLCNLDSLIELTTDLESLLGRGDRSRKLADVLPMSIEKVHLVMGYVTVSEFRKIIRDLLEVKSKQVPNLYFLDFSEVTIGAVLKEEGMRTACAMAGILLEYPNPCR